MRFPEYRLRRLRKTESLRKLFSETEISVSDFIMPYFVIEGKNIKQPINSMPGIFRLSIDNLFKELEIVYDIGIPAILIFGITKRKDKVGSESYNKNGIVQHAVKKIKKLFPDLVVITDVCLCGYTLDGHCGILANSKRKIHKSKTVNQKPEIDNDETLKILAKVALSHAHAGADFVAPSAMMDGQVRVIREILDKNGFFDTGIIAYSVKYASNFYGPFREALDSRPQFGDRKSYQMDYRNSDEALREIEQDINENADIVMVKPALAYLDIIYRAKQKFNIPIAAYNVSGEYSLVKFGTQKGIVNEKEVVLEILTSIKRAGADLIISYHAKEVASWLMANSL